MRLAWIRPIGSVTRLTCWGLLALPQPHPLTTFGSVTACPAGRTLNRLFLNVGSTSVPTRDNSEHLAETALLDYGHASLRKLICDRGWRSLPVGRRIGAVYSFVRDEIPFGYNISDRISASQVLADGYGQCNTKTILLMALLRGVGIPCRVHGATIHKRLQKGVVNGLWYRMAPKNIIHTWAEVLVDGRWVAMEGVILDSRYLDGLRALVSQNHGAFLGYAVGTDDLASPPVDWQGDDTAIQMTGVNSDLGSYDDPDAFYAEHGANLSGFKEWLYRHVVRQRMNGKVASIRGCPPTPSCVAHSAAARGRSGPATGPGK